MQAADRSNAPALVAPSWSWIRQAVAGKIYSGLDVAQMMRSISVGLRFATCNALIDASTANVEANSPSPAICRSRIPVRSRIHWSLV